MTVGADAEELHVDAAGPLDRRLVALPRVGQRRLGRVRAVDPLGRDADRIGELPPDGRQIGLLVAIGQADVLVEVEGLHARVRRPAAVLGAPDELFVGRQRGRARRQPEHGRGVVGRPAAYDCFDRVRGESRHGGGIVQDHYFHVSPSSGSGFEGCAEE